MNSANRVALNTLVIYGRMVITVGISLYTTRVVLSALGAEDYGIFNLIGGIILMLSFLNAAMSASTQRFLSYYQGRDERLEQRRVFSNSLMLHLLIGLVLVGFIEASTSVVFKYLIEIREERLLSAEYVYHFMAVNVFLVVITVPFNATLIAHENMLWVAFVNIAETVLKLIIAIYLRSVEIDRLVTYGGLMTVVSLVSLFLYAIFCFKKYAECRLTFWKDGSKGLLITLGSFAGWNLFGALCGLGRNQGLAILLNRFFGVRVNAAYAMSNQVSTQLNFLSVTMLRALNPQIMKSEGGGDRDRMLRLSVSGSKFCVYLLGLLAIPFIFEMPSILAFWLTEIPPYTTIFCQLILLATLISQLTVGLQSAIQATGNIKFYQMVVGCILISTLPIALLVLRLGYPPFVVFYVYCAVETVACGFRVYFLRKYAGLSVRYFVINNIVKNLVPLGVSILSSALVVTFLEFNFRFLFTIAFSGMFFTLSFYFCGLSLYEKDIVNRMVQSVFRKINRREPRGVSS